ncbi:serine/threonine protein kinase [Microbacterium sp. LRZ72]|uniref:serine/threonine-protein kinase n=1 Tax=Microbacterium sp. LRZ72 TaxID=2942481 RepID=UPI0029BF380C|nr:serine/threonine-protein kinase [Microbacterium sp. LRZ72]MDX2376641.1 serine/threonine protein kinase [Microbacterium sp. LRZ72]
MAKRLPSDPPILPGFSYVRPLGSGGFADVFLYEQDMPRRLVAVKVLPSDVDDADLMRMFNAEADVLAHLSAHPSIVTVYQAGISAEGRPYIVMEYCPGSLAQRYRLERMPVSEVLAIGVKMAGALESAHRAGLIHRDIKPSNILITSFGAPVLADFGISSSLARDRAGDPLAMSVPWSAPEVITEATAGDISSEVWALGATVYSLLAGHSPFERPERGQNTREHLRRRITRASLPRLARADAPDDLQEVLAATMHRDPSRRPASALEVAEALQQVQVRLGEPPTPVEVAASEWMPQAAAVDFADAALRGPVRTSIPQRTTRKAPARVGLAALARDEDDEISGPREPRRALWPWVVGAAVVLGVGILAGVIGAMIGAGSL